MKKARFAKNQPKSRISKNIGCEIRLKFIISSSNFESGLIFYILTYLLAE